MSSAEASQERGAQREVLEGVLLGLVSLALVALPHQPWWTLAFSALEAWATVSLAWSVWLLAHNRPLGWWVGLIGVVLYGVVFYRYRLYGEVLLQGFYFVTSLQAIWIWLRAGPAREERPVGSLAPRWQALSAGVGVVAWLGLWRLLLEREGAAPPWDALTTVLSVIAHVWLMGRYYQSWYLWVLVDTVYVPLYASRGLYLTAVLYALFWVLALRGLLEFRRLYAARGEAAP